jgi:predicted FMN-binding regulatory protein PaiB
MLAVYEPEGEYEPLVDGSFYGPRLRQLVAVKLRILHTEAKFKLGPAGPERDKRRVIAGLRERGGPNDARAAAVIEASLT